MNIFVTSSPYLDGADRAILNPENHFVENLREVLPPFPRVLFVASDQERHDLTCSFGMDTAVAFCQAGMPFSAFQVLDGNRTEGNPPGFPGNHNGHQRRLHEPGRYGLYSARGGGRGR